MRNQSGPPRSRSPLAVGAIVLAVTLAGLVALRPRKETGAPAPASPATGAPVWQAAAVESARVPLPAQRTAVSVRPAAAANALPDPRTYPPDPADPFAADMFDKPAPEIIHDARARYMLGKRFTAPMRMGLYRYGEEHPKDPRPQLLLAYDEMRLGWSRAAVGHYERALDADPGIKRHPKILPDLLLLVSGSDHGRASRAIQKHFARTALVEVDRAIEEARLRGESRRVARLEELRKTL